MPQKLDWKTWLPAVLFTVVGTFYTFLSDISSALQSVWLFKECPLFPLKLLLVATVVFLAFVFFFLPRRVARFYAKRFGFAQVLPQWLPGTPEGNVLVSRSVLLDTFLKSKPKELWIASVSGDWDFVRALRDNELRTYRHTTSTLFKFLLCHPDGGGLEKHCADEGNLDIATMRKKICRNTRKLVESLHDQCEVRWFYCQPAFHVIGSSDLLHFGYFPKRQQGHFSHRYVATSECGMYKALSTWFEDTWDSAVDARNELAWVERSVNRDKAVFLDRDGTLIEDAGYHGRAGARVRICSGVVEGLKQLYQRGYRLIVVSNQQAVGIQLRSEDDLIAFTKVLKDNFADEDVLFDAIYYCTHAKAEQCTCRKPNPRLFDRAIKRFHLDVNRCHFIGDADSDVQVGSHFKGLTVHKISAEKSFLQICTEEVR